MKNKTKALLSTSTLFAVIAIVIPAKAGQLDGKDANVMVLEELHVNSLGLIGALIGPDPGHQLPWSGTVGDTSWAFGMSSPYRDGMLSMNYAGNLDPATSLATWHGAVSFTDTSGTLAWTSNGSYTNA